MEHLSQTVPALAILGPSVPSTWSMRTPQFLFDKNNTGCKERRRLLNSVLEPFFPIVKLGRGTHKMAITLEIRRDSFQALLLRAGTLDREQRIRTRRRQREGF